MTDKQDSLDETTVELALAYLARADHAADTLRGLLFALSTAVIGFVAFRAEINPLTIVASGYFAIAIGLTVLSWDLQKSKAVKRFRRLRDKGYKSYTELNKTIDREWWSHNHFYDRLSYIFIAAGALAEFLALAR